MTNAEVKTYTEGLVQAQDYDPDTSWFPAQAAIGWAEGVTVAIQATQRKAVDVCKGIEVSWDVEGDCVLVGFTKNFFSHKEMSKILKGMMRR